MSDRQQTPDIMADLLGGAEEPAPRAEAQNTSIPASQHTGTMAKQYTGKPVRQQARKPAKQPDSKLAEPAPGEAKAKATYYLSPEAIDRLDQAWLKLRKLAKASDKTGISKSLIVEQAILLATEELEAKGARSRLASKTVKQ